MDGEPYRPIRGQTLGGDDSTALFLVVRVDRPVSMPTLDGAPLAVRQPPWCGDLASPRGSSVVAGAWYGDAVTGLLLRCTRGGNGILRVEDRVMTQTRGPRLRPRPVLRPAPRRVAR
jgi:hypothetical protein